MEPLLKDLLSDAKAFQVLSKLSPAAATRARSWVRSFPADSRPLLARMVVDRSEQDSWVGSLRKSQVGVTVHDNGSLRLDFPGDLPENVKDMAMRWAKKRGLKPIEASLAKNVGGRSHAVFVAPCSAPVRQRFILEIE